MDRKKYHWLLIVLCMITAGCSKEFALTLDDTRSFYVIEGRISNLEGPYFVRVTKSTNQLSGGENIEAVTNALVILSDDAGTKDTLMPADLSKIQRYAYVLRNDGSLDSIASNFELNIYTSERGYYQTTHIKGAPGHTYYLEVQAGDTFHATAYMPFAPALDSAVIRETVVTPKGAKGLLPFVYFKEPENEKNYYLLQFNDVSFFRYDQPERSGYGDYTFPFYVVDDNILPSYVNGLAVRVVFSGHTPYSGSTYFNLYSAQQVRLSSLTKEAYEYFRVLISQFEDDGNAYKPVPTSAAGNFSGGALGLFYATHVSDKLARP